MPKEGFSADISGGGFIIAQNAVVSLSAPWMQLINHSQLIPEAGAALSGNGLPLLSL